MQCVINNDQLTITGAARLPGVPTAKGKAFSNSNGREGVYVRGNRIILEVSEHPGARNLTIPPEVNQTDLERLLDDALVFTGDMTADSRDEKWSIGAYAPNTQ